MALTIGGAPVAAMPAPVPPEIGTRLTDISPLMGPLTAHHGLVVGRLTAWIGDAVPHAFDDLLWTPVNAAAGAAMRVNAETGARAAAFRTFARDLSRHFANCGQVTDESQGPARQLRGERCRRRRPAVVQRRRRRERARLDEAVPAGRRRRNNCRQVQAPADAPGVGGRPGDRHERLRLS